MHNGRWYFGLGSKYLLPLFSFVASIASASADLSSKTVCVLNYERKAHAYTKVIDSVFSKSSQTEVIHEAIPADLSRCARDGVEEIVLVAHAGVLPWNQDMASLVYFKALSSEEKTQAIAHAKSALIPQIHDLEQRTQDRRITPPPNAHEHGAAALTLTPDERKLLSLQRQLRALEKIPADTTLYAPPKLFLPMAFEQLAQELRELSLKGSQHLKKIRIATCHAHKIQQRYAKELGVLQDELNIQIEFARDNKVMSFIERDEVSSLSRAWLKQSLRR